MTTNQLAIHGRKKKRRKSDAPALDGRPQLAGTVTRSWAMKPKKPNSAQRHVVRVTLSNKKEVTAYCGGENSDVQVHHHVLVRGGRVPDLPGVRYHLVRGALDFTGDKCTSKCTCEPGNGGDRQKRNQGRSKYGVKRWKNK
jgi:small subunit ribosomal protein S12